MAYSDSGEPELGKLSTRGRSENLWWFYLHWVCSDNIMIVLSNSVVFNWDTVSG